jgi:tRNA-intron endonuclease
MKQTAIYTKGHFIILDIENGPLLYKIGFFGKPLEINKPKTPIFKARMILSFYEALYLMENEELEILEESGLKMSREKLISEANKFIDNFLEKYNVYKDLRNKGLVVKSGMKYGVTFMVYKYGPGIDHAPFLVDVVIRQEKISSLEILRAGRLSHNVRKKLLLASVDPISRKITYYMIKWFI